MKDAAITVDRRRSISISPAYYFKNQNLVHFCDSSSSSSSATTEPQQDRTGNAVCGFPVSQHRDMISKENQEIYELLERLTIEEQVSPSLTTLLGEWAAFSS
jgi:hypothetical protein